MATLSLTRTSSITGSDVTSRSFSTTQSLTGSSWTVLQETITTGTDTQVFVTVDVSAVKYFRIHSTTAATIETNDGTTPDNTITLGANEYYEYATGDDAAFLLTVDVVNLFVTNAASTVLTVEVCQDATP